MNADAHNWSHDDFPKPNPYFPPPPRPRRWRGYLVVLALFVLGVADFALIPVLEFDKAGPFLLWGLGGCICFIAAILILNDLARASVWRKGCILPGRVIREPSGPPAGAVWHLLGFIPTVGLLITFVSGWVEGSRNAAVLAVKRNGETDVLDLKTSRHWKHYRDNLDVWLLLNRKGKAVPIETVAPRKFHFVDVPDEVSEWLDEAIAPEYRPQVEQHLQEITEREMAKAAAANTRTFRRST